MMPEKSELRERLEASVLPVCLECGSENTEVYAFKPTRFDHTYGYVTEDTQRVMDDTYKCRDCKAIFHTEKIAK